MMGKHQQNTGLSRVPQGRASFRQQLAIAFFIGILLLALASSFAVWSFSSRTIQIKLVEQGRQVTEAFAAQSTLALLYYSADNAEEAAKATLGFPDVLGVAVYDLQHRALLTKGEDPSPIGESGDWPQELEVELETPHAWHFISPVFAFQDETEEASSPFGTERPESELIGYVRVLMGKNTLNVMGSQILRANLLVSATLATVLLVVLLMITTRLTRPLKRLASVMQRAQLGEKHVRAELHGPKDIIDMERAFNTMMAVLEGREEELEAARDAAFESARIKGEFAANVTHELRTPLNGVLGMLELLQEMGLTPKQREYVEVARNSGQSLLALIGEILDFSRMDATKAELNAADFETHTLLEDVVGLLAHQAQQKGLEVGFLVSEEVPSVLCGDPERIRQVVLNLIGNAIKFTERGEVYVQVDMVADEDVQLVLRFGVHDTGIGIAREARERIFEAFRQADGTTTRKYGGTGLGLAISRQLVTLMGGDIGVESEPGRGSEFWFTVPLKRGTQVASRLDYSDTNEVSGLRVLIVDDSHISRAFLAQTLSGWGMKHETVADGSQALQTLRSAAARATSYDLAVVAGEMRGMPGVEIARRVAREPSIGAVKVILMTDQGDVRFNGALPEGVSHVITKPVRASQLYDCIAEIVRGRGVSTPPETTRSTTELLPQGKQILVVEDNRANQQVAIGMLERLGCKVEVVASGLEAVEAHVRQQFDLVLMDCHMPEMDGYEATGRIRALRGTKSKTPIVAMTADVREGDSDRCFAAGMDDYLPKPIRLDSLRKVLEHWLCQADDSAGLETQEPAAIAVPAAESDPVSEGEALDGNVLRELQEDVGEAFPRLVSVFLEDTPEHLASLRDAVWERDQQWVAESAHTIKGSARNLGATRLGEICFQLEEMGRSGALDRAEELLHSLDAEYEQVKEALQGETWSVTEERTEVPEERGHILVVDDDRGMRFALRKVLEADGYRISEAGDGAQALAACQQEMPDLVLMDAVMPVMDGFTACTHIHELPDTVHPPVLIITALDEESSIERAFGAGATDYIPKPVHFALLRQRVLRLVVAGRAQKDVQQLAYQDSLTGLPNRAMFRKQFEQLISRPFTRGEMIALLLLDLDRFKLVNDTLGHDAGDTLLKAAAQRVSGCVREGDVVARLGGDEFTVIVEGMHSPEAVAVLAEKIRHALAEPFVLMKQEVYVSTSIGISLYPVDGTDVPTLIKRADTAMFRAKEQGEGYSFYEFGMELAVAKQLELERDLRRALERNELVVYYQPQADTMTGRIVAMEALVRWQHPVRGLVPPLDFIPIAEETGLIAPLGEWVLRQACMQLQAWRREGFDELSVAVNVSGRQLQEKNLVDKVSAVLEETGLPSSRIELEITESVIMKSAEAVTPVLQELKDKGIRVAIDDFGTGYSSLSYLKRFPIDTLKVDRSFVSDIGSDSDDAVITTAIIALAKSLRLTVVAEGVETSEQQAFLQAQGCDLMQGYYLSKPLPAPEFEEKVLRRTQSEQVPGAEIRPLRTGDHGA